jgi:hypothetical protein
LVHRLCPCGCAGSGGGVFAGARWRGSAPRRRWRRAARNIFSITRGEDGPTHAVRQEAHLAFDWVLLLLILALLGAES